MSDGLLAKLREAVGPETLVTSAEAVGPYLADWRGAYAGRACAVARPRSTEEVAAVVAVCAAARVPVVPQGGRTGMCGGAAPDQSGRSVVVSLERMNRIIHIDARNNTATVEAGCILAEVRKAAEAADRFFPLSLAAEGSCQIGGNLSTNAGGINVLRYGNARELTLGLEAVLPDGSTWEGLRGLRKDNTGYDLKQLFIGAEGTLGVITRAVLKLFPLPKARLTAFAALHDLTGALDLLTLVRSNCGDRVSAFEIISCSCVDMVLRQIPDVRNPLPVEASWYALLELSDVKEEASLRPALEVAFGIAMERGLVVDAVLAESLAHERALWRLRESIPEAGRLEGTLFRSDIAVPIGAVPRFVAEATGTLQREPGIQVICFGHLGDGNLHFNAILPDTDRGRMARINDVVTDLVFRHDGTISAEHGIGQAKRADLARHKTPRELSLMRTLKAALDPANIMNPGKVL